MLVLVRIKIQPPTPESTAKKMAYFIAVGVVDMNCVIGVVCVACIVGVVCVACALSCSRGTA